MEKSNYIHGSNIEAKLQSSKYHEVLAILDELHARYIVWKDNMEALNSESERGILRKVELLNEYKNYVDEIAAKHVDPHDKLASSVIEEFLFHLFRDIPSVKSSSGEGLIFMGQAEAYTDMSFAPRSFMDFSENPGVYINRKTQDFTISKMVKCVFETNGKKQIAGFAVPAVAIECKAYIPSTMLGQSAYEANRLKQGNPYALFLIVAEQNALSDDINLKNSPIDEIFILRKEKRIQGKKRIERRKPIDCEIVKELYEFVKEHLNKEWFNPAKATERGRLINIKEEVKVS